MLWQKIERVKKIDEKSNNSKQSIYNHNRQQEPYQKAGVISNDQDRIEQIKSSHRKTFKNEQNICLIVHVLVSYIGLVQFISL